ncbi:hypothetical protein LguiA_023393 [Lonicera macranthoides]
MISIPTQIKVSLDRIASFLRLEDMQPDVIEKIPRDINFILSHGMRVAVCGTVGSGKSTLLSCILREVPKISGSVKLSGTKACVAQSPWIQSGKIEDNILFGKEMDRERYEKVIEACSLNKDLEILPFGDQTVIGERGINLSGGQKQRIQFAHALYRDADIYLFDDPFSAVDAHTGSHLFKVTREVVSFYVLNRQECILRLLDLKTVIYVTHQVEFLPTADLISCLWQKDKVVAVMGTCMRDSPSLKEANVGLISCNNGVKGTKETGAPAVADGQQGSLRRSAPTSHTASGIPLGTSHYRDVVIEISEALALKGKMTITMEEEVLYVVNELRVVLRKYDKEKDEWEEIVEDES